MSDWQKHVCNESIMSDPRHSSALLVIKSMDNPLPLRMLLESGLCLCSKPANTSSHSIHVNIDYSTLESLAHTLKQYFAVMKTVDWTNLICWLFANLILPVSRKKEEWWTNRAFFSSMSCHKERTRERLLLILFLCNYHIQFNHLLRSKSIGAP